MERPEQKGSGKGGPLHDKIRDCYRRAAECRECSLAEKNAQLKADFLAMEGHWISLAHSYELTESLSEFSPEIRKQLG